MIKPILFNTDMVRAILDHTKSCTRRAIKGEILNDAAWGYTMLTPKGYISCRGMHKGEHVEKFFKLPCEKGDILYVRESIFQGVARSLDISGEFTTFMTEDFEYYADGKHAKEHWKDKEQLIWMSRRPSIHMPKEAARIFLKVTDVRVERLRDITEEQAEREGTQYYCPKCESYKIGRAHV